MISTTYLYLEALKSKLKTPKKVAAYLDENVGLIKFYLQNPTINASERKRNIFQRAYIKLGFERQKWTNKQH